MYTTIRFFKGGRHLAVALFCVLVITGLAIATWDVHSHTSSGTISSTPTITVTGTHIVQVQAEANGGLGAYVWNGTYVIGTVEAQNGACKRASGSLTSGGNYSFYSYTFDYVSGTGTAWLANSGNPNLPSCGGSKYPQP